MSYNDEIAIQIKNVTKVYKIFRSPGERFLYHMFHTHKGKNFIALDNISFEVKRGESFGIIGRNGSGKSTMLQILAGIINATSGEVNVNGKIAALLELGSGFNPESTGYENIYMNAAILGVSKVDIEKKIQRIIDFADIGDFLNQPVKTYSSGMYVRLAFSVAINVDADILLIDEALAVGDVFFRQKCYTRLNQLKKEGKTIILVSHGMNEVEQFCDRSLLLDKSLMIMCGDSRDAVQEYYMLDHKRKEHNDLDETSSEDEKTIDDMQISDLTYHFDGWRLQNNAIFNCTKGINNDLNTGKVHFTNVGIFNSKGIPTNVFHQGEEGFFLYEVDINENIDVPLLGIVFYDQRNTIIFGKDNLQTYTEVPESVKKGSKISYLFNIKMDIAVGEYTFDAGFNTIKQADYLKRDISKQEEVNQAIERICCLTKVGNFSIHERLVGDPMKIMFHGCCNLPSKTQMLIN